MQVVFPTSIILDQNVEHAVTSLVQAKCIRQYQDRIILPLEEGELRFPITPAERQHMTTLVEALCYPRVQVTPLAHLYRDQPSPAIDVLQDDVVAYMRTRLFLYQRHALSKMLLLEEGQTMPDPDAISLEGGYYSWSQARCFPGKPKEYQCSRGGILCEEMGTGKTCICIALVMQTRWNTSQAPPGVKVHCGMGRGTLKEIAAATVLTHSLPLARDALPPGCLEMMQHIPYYYKDADTKTSFRAGNTSATKFYLTRATLIVVPDNLVDHWMDEWCKHVHMDNVKMHVFTKSGQELASAQELADCDVVLVSQNRLAMEWRRTDTAFIGVARQCTCSYVGSTREIHCRCHASHVPYTSPLLHVHWKRLIVDEGHVLRSTSTDRARIATTLTVDHHWVCTGTPSVNLLSTQTNATTTEAAAKDLDNLGSLIGTFLGQEPFASSSSLWKQLISRPFQNKSARAYMTMRDLMHRYMVRSQLNVIEAQVSLPPLYERAVILDLEPVQIRSYNVVAALFHINAISSQRQDEDYMFHKNKRKYLLELTNNLRLSCFWFVPEMTYINDAYAIGSKEGRERAQSDQDKHDLQASLDALSTVKDDPQWRALAASREPFLLVPLAEKPRVTLQELQSIKKQLTPLEHVDILGTSSSKLTYMISRILQHRTNHEKTLVFAESILEAYYLDTALQLANIRVLLYHTNMSLSQRSLSITTFNTNATVSVMIMTTFSAAYGINLPVASRVYFISPVWQRDVERQAIKRAHRMGQTRPVYVETLVARGTVEEHMYACRNESTSKDMVENASMRRVLDSLHFIHSVQETRRKVLFTLQPKSSIHEGISTKRSVEQDDTRHVHIKL